MANKTTVYDPKKVTVVLGNHIASGFAEDSFVKVEKAGDGTTLVTGCDGEGCWQVDPNHSHTVTISLLQNSETNAWLQSRADMMEANGNGQFPLSIKDNYGGQSFYASECVVAKSAGRGRGKSQTNNEWTITTYDGTFDEG